MNKQHTPGPWGYGEDNDGWYVEKDGIQIAHGLTEADARRIVACVNACEAIPIDGLEAMPKGPAGLLPMYARLIDERDDLHVRATQYAALNDQQAKRIAKLEQQRDDLSVALADMRRDMDRDITQLMQQRDELLAALDELEQYARGFSVSGVYLAEEIEGKRLLDMACAAIARAKGE